MPYSSIRSLPKPVKDALPTEAQRQFMRVVNSQLERGLSEERAFASAWSTIKQNWRKDDDGKWHKIEKAVVEVPITKVDESQNLVFGWANVSIGKDGELITDSQDDQIDIEELERAAYEFMLYFGESGVLHEGEAVGKVIESFVVTPEKLEKMGLPSDALPIGWWFGAYIEDDEAFQKVVSGEYSMFSIQGTAIREAA